MSLPAMFLAVFGRRAWHQKGPGWHWVGCFPPLVHDRAKETVLPPYTASISSTEGFSQSGQVILGHGTNN